MGKKGQFFSKWKKFKSLQYFNSIKNNDSDPNLIQNTEFKNEKEPTTVNLGIGIIL